MSTAPATETYSPGLEGVIAGETAISTVTGGLRYRGYPVPELADKTSFEEVAHLMLHGELPTASQLNAFRGRVAAEMKLPAPLLTIMRSLSKDAPPMDTLRTAVSVLGNFDPEANAIDRDANLRKAERLLGQAPVAVAYQYRINKGLEPIPPRTDLPLAANFLHMIRGKEPKPDEAKAFDVTLILYAEHEFNASTFAARVICSTMADLHCSIVGAIGALKGPLHGGANERVMDLLQKIGTPEKVEPWLKDAFARKERLMGFGHRVYKHGDVRANYLKNISLRLAKAAGNETWEQIAEGVEKVLERDKNLLPNLDWPSARVYYSLGLEVPLYTPIFVMSRITGWSAHVIEQLGANRLIRPRAKYTGLEVRVVPALSERK